MPQVRTHRELYRAGIEIARRHRPDRRPLETWLRALLGLLPRVADRDELAVDELLQLLDDAFVAPPLELDPRWASLPPVMPREGVTALEVVRTLQRQVADLHLLAGSGALRRADRSVGAEVPGGGRWYNLEPASFIEAGLQGALGGYGLDESSRVMQMPAELRGAGQSGEILMRTIPMTHLTWDDVHSLLVCGQCHE